MAKQDIGEQLRPESALAASSSEGFTILDAIDAENEDIFGSFVPLLTIVG